MAATAAQNCLPSRSRTLIASADPLLRKRVMKKSVYFDSLFEEAIGGAHALAKLKHTVCDSVVLDRHLPDLDSTELGALIQKMYPGTEVGFVDSEGATADAVEVSGGGPYNSASGLTAVRVVTDGLLA
jgi:hypothetical protein